MNYEVGNHGRFVDTLIANIRFSLTVYNCRSSAEWKEDMALSVTYSLDNRSTKAVLYGCTESTRDVMIERLKRCNYVVHHPLAIPALFCDIERKRQFDLVDPITRKLSDRALKIAKPQRPGSPSLNLSRNNSTAWAQETGVQEDSEDLMSLWLEASDLKRGLQTWKRELEKLIVHSDELGQDRPQKGPEGSEDLEQRRFKDAGKRIRERLVELNGEYDEKIRQCADIIDGMVLAAQLVRSSFPFTGLHFLIQAANLINLLRLIIKEFRNGTTLDKKIRGPISAYPVPI